MGAAGGLQNIWQLQAFAENGGAPVGRYGHTLTLLDPSPEAGSAVLVLFGGNGAWDDLLGDLWKMHLNDVTSSRWELIRPACPSEGCPVNRTQHAADVIDGKMYMFGGITSGGALSDELWVWDSGASSGASSGAGSWQKISAVDCINDPTGAVPPATTEHTFAAVGASRLVLFGGNQSTGSNGGAVVTNATWEFDTSTSCWTQLTPTMDKDKILLGRIGHSAVVFNSTDSSNGKEMHVMFGRGTELYPEDISWKLVISSSDAGLR